MAFLIKLQEEKGEVDTKDGEGLLAKIFKKGIKKRKKLESLGVGKLTGQCLGGGRGDREDGGT